MDHRLTLQTTLETIKGIKHVYFNPPVSTKMEYPCIRFSLNRRTAIFADDRKYIKGESYILTFITRDVVNAPKVLDQIEDLPNTIFDRTYVSDGLYHYVYTKTY